VPASLSAVELLVAVESVTAFFQFLLPARVWPYWLGITKSLGSHDVHDNTTKGGGSTRFGGVN